MSTIRVHFATNRNRTDGEEMFGSGYFDPADYGRYITGSILATRVADDTVLPDSGWVVRADTLQLDPPATLLAADSGSAAADTGMEAFYRASQALRAPAEVMTAEAQSMPFSIVVIHGFMASFPVSIARAAQVAFNYGASVAYSYSWPAGEFLGLDEYQATKIRAQRSALPIALSLMRLFQLADDDSASATPRIVLCAHSMGCFALAEAVQYVAQHRPELFKNVLFEATLLMAADEEHTALAPQGRLAPLISKSRRIAVYTSGNDQVLLASHAANGFRQRLGQGAIYGHNTLPKTITRVDATAVSYTAPDRGAQIHFYHQYYRIKPKVIADVRSVIAGRDPASMPTRYRHENHDYDGRNWYIPLADV